MKKRIKDLTEEEIERLPDKDFIIITNYNGRKARIFKTFILTSLYGTIDIPQKHILNKQEHDYLRAVCKPYKVVHICKNETGSGNKWITICTKTQVYDGQTGILRMPLFKPDTMYKNMEPNKNYTIEELELDKEWEQ